MSTMRFSHIACFVGASVLGAAVPAAAASVSVVYAFHGKADGVGPTGDLLLVNGQLYGTTAYNGGDGYGTAFAVSPAGKFRLLHTFTGGKDGGWPRAGLVARNGVLIGTTFVGGKIGGGTVFSLTDTGKEAIVHPFALLNDGTDPSAPVLVQGKDLYGTTTQGGSNTVYGTVWRITNGTSETMLHNFGPGEGGYPLGNLLISGGYLWGTNYLGGSYGGGTVFKISLATGAFTLVHSFGNGSDGSRPLAGLTSIGGVLYGTTAFGGSPACPATSQQPAGCGTVFKIAADGSETVVYAFNGVAPMAPSPLPICCITMGYSMARRFRAEIQTAVMPMAVAPCFR